MNVRAFNHWFYRPGLSYNQLVLHFHNLLCEIINLLVRIKSHKLRISVWRYIFIVLVLKAIKYYLNLFQNFFSQKLLVNFCFRLISMRIYDINNLSYLIVSNINLFICCLLRACNTLLQTWNNSLSFSSFSLRVKSH